MAIEKIMNVELAVGILDLDSCSDITQSSLKKSFWKMMWKYHPDIYERKYSTQFSQIINAAYKYLSVPERLISLSNSGIKTTKELAKNYGVNESNITISYNDPTLERIIETITDVIVEGESSEDKLIKVLLQFNSLQHGLVRPYIFNLLNEKVGNKFGDDFLALLQSENRTEFDKILGSLNSAIYILNNHNKQY